MRYLDIGSVSSGTMRQEDLIPAFWSELHSIDPDTADEMKRLVALEYGAVDKDDGGWTWNEKWLLSQEGDYVLQDLFDELNEHCPPYCYFGSVEGDGADYGCWVSWDSVDEAVLSGNLVKVNSGDPWPLEDEILEVNDHDNVTLWIWDADEGKHVVAWSVV